MIKIKAVVFDLGGVLIDWNPEYLYRQIFQDKKEMDYFLSEICTPAWNEEQDGGRTLSDATEMLVKEHPRYEAEIRAYYGRWHEMLKGPIEETVHILKKLKEKTSPPGLFALTNWSAETFPIAYQQYEFLHWFEGIIVSGQEHIRKPFPEIFRLLCERYNLTPESSLFIDDNLGNVKAAEKSGFKVIHYHSPEQLKQALGKNGIIL